jgi:ribosomal protein L7/L12
MSPNASPLPPEAAAALARGELVQAIKLLRASTGMGLKDAKDAVEAHAARRESGALPSPAASDNSGKFVFPEAAGAAVARGDFITAIAMLRSANPRLDLKTAKDAVDRYRQSASPARNASQPKVQAQYSARVPTVMAGDRGSHAWLLAVIVIALAALAYWVFASGA